MAKLDRISDIAIQLKSLWAERRMPEAWDLIINNIRERSYDEEFGRVAAEFLEQNKRTYKRTNSKPTEKKKSGQPKKEVISKWHEIGKRYEELQFKGAKYKVQTLEKEFKRSNTTIQRALKIYWKAKQRDD